MPATQLITSESVSEGHPDKMADQISDAVLDAILTQDPHGRVACETLVKTGMVLVAGEITTSAWVDLEELVRERPPFHRSMRSSAPPAVYWRITPAMKSWPANPTAQATIR